MSFIIGEVGGGPKVLVSSYSSLQKLPGSSGFLTALPHLLPYSFSVDHLTRFILRNLNSIEYNGRPDQCRSPCHGHHRTATDMRQWFYVYRRYLQGAWWGCEPDHQNSRAKSSELSPPTE